MGPHRLAPRQERPRGRGGGKFYIFLHVNVVTSRGALAVVDAGVAVVVDAAGGDGGVAAAAVTAAAKLTVTPVERRQSSTVSCSPWRSCLA